jgi:hypothetical protein
VVGVVIGVDFDNTLADWDEIMHREALRQGLIPPGVGPNKRDVRDSIRRRPHGELEWQRLQAGVYAARAGEPRLVDGVAEFFRACRDRRVRISVVSHKTERASLDETSTDLRAVALSWMASQRFFAPDGFGLSPDDVHFEPTRRRKIERIGELGCTHFVDDLEETFLEERFPPQVEKILFAPHDRPSALPPGVRIARTWHDIREWLLGDDA